MNRKIAWENICGKHELWQHTRNFALNWSLILNKKIEFSFMKITSNPRKILILELYFFFGGFLNCYCLFYLSYCIRFVSFLVVIVVETLTPFFVKIVYCVWVPVRLALNFNIKLFVILKQDFFRIRLFYYAQNKCS